MPSIGQTLQYAREDQHITLDKASEVTRIRVAYLKALEADDHAALPSPVQARGFLRNYAEYLGLNFDQLIENMRASKKGGNEIIGPMDLTPETADQTSERLTASQTALPITPEPDAVAQIESPLLASTPQATIRRGRKKPESAMVDDAQPEFLAESNVEEQAGSGDATWQTWLSRMSTAVSSVKDDAAVTETSAEKSTEIQFQAADTESANIFREIGDILRNRRELLSLHLDEIERNTHVKAHYLEALEKGAMQDLPSTVQTRGMLSNYASFLDLDVDALLLRYADALQARHREKNPQRSVRKPGQPIVASLPPLRSFIAGDMIFGVGVAILLIAFSTWGINWVLTIQSQQEVQPTAPSISDVLLATPDALLSPTTTPLPAELFLEATQTIVIPTQNLNVNVQVNLIAVERTFMRVLADGEEVFNGRVVPGTAYLFEAEEQVEVLVGSGAAIRVTYNGRDLGLLGGLGQVISIIYREEEIITPTALPTITPTNTPPVSPTLPATLTPVITNTPLP